MQRFLSDTTTQLVKQTTYDNLTLYETMAPQNNILKLNAHSRIAVFILLRYQTYFLLANEIAR